MPLSPSTKLRLHHCPCSISKGNTFTIFLTKRLILLSSEFNYCETSTPTLYHIKDISSLSIVYLSWCDPTASICGRLWGRYTPRFNNKSLAGSLGAAIAGVLVTYGFFTYMTANGFDHPSWSPNAPAPLALVALYGGSVAAFAEGVDLFGWDDNLTIPVLSAAMMWGMLALGGLGVAAWTACLE